MVRITNVKVSCKIPEIALNDVKEICKEKEISYKCFNNFVVFRTKGFTYTLFKKRSHLDSLKECKKIEDQKCHCNITKCLFSNVRKALKTLALLIKCEYSDLQYTIDTITAAGCLGFGLDLENAVSENTCLSNKIKFNPEVFPGIFISVAPSIKGIFFRSGKYVIVGCRSIKEIINSKKWLTQKVAVIHRKH